MVGAKHGGIVAHAIGGASRFPERAANARHVICHFTPGLFHSTIVTLSRHRIYHLTNPWIGRELFVLDCLVFIRLDLNLALASTPRTRPVHWTQRMPSDPKLALLCDALVDSLITSKVQVSTRLYEDTSRRLLSGNQKPPIGDATSRGQISL